MIKLSLNKRFDIGTVICPRAVVLIRGRISSLIIIGYNMAMVCKGPVLAQLRQYRPEGFYYRL